MTHRWEDWEYRVRWFYLTHPQRYSFQSSWLPVEDYTLHALQEIGCPWHCVPDCFKRDGRDTHECRKRYERIFVEKFWVDEWDARWTEPEKSRLCNVHKWDWSRNWDWAKIATLMPGKSSKECERQYFFLNPPPVQSSTTIDCSVTRRQPRYSTTYE